MAEAAENPPEEPSVRHELRHNGRFVASYPSAAEAKKMRGDLFGDDSTATIEPARAFELHSDLGFHDSFHSEVEAKVEGERLIAKRAALIAQYQSSEMPTEEVAVVIGHVKDRYPETYEVKAR